MNILLVDDEYLALEDLELTIKEACPNDNIYAFSRSKHALESAALRAYDIAFLDIEMPEMNGIELAKELQSIFPQINIIFVTAYSEYSFDAHQIHASGYVMKPANLTRIKEELSALRFDIKESDNKLQIQCFGNFEILVDGKPVVFKRTKTKELVAFLVDRNGSSITAAQACDVILKNIEDTNTARSYFRQLVSDMKSTLANHGYDNILYHSRNQYAINTDAIDCDYYKFMEGNESVLHTYQGEYMTQYEWAKKKLSRPKK